MTTFPGMSACLALGALVLSSCNFTPAGPTYPTQAAQVSSISGNVSGWTQGSANVKIVTSSVATLATGGIDASGRLNLALPSGSVMTPHLLAATTSVVNEQGCTGSFTSSDQQARAYAVSELDVTQGTAAVGKVVALTSTVVADTDTRFELGLTGREWHYADRPVKLTGSLTCTDVVEGVPISVTITSDLNLSAGWNATGVAGNLTLTASSASMHLSLHNALDGTSTWQRASAATPLSSGTSLSSLGTGPSVGDLVGRAREGLNLVYR